MNIQLGPTGKINMEKRKERSSVEQIHVFNRLDINLNWECAARLSIILSVLEKYAGGIRQQQIYLCSNLQPMRLDVGILQHGMRARNATKQL